MGCLSGLVHELTSLPLNQHMRILKKTPFRHLFEAIFEGKLQPNMCKRFNKTIRRIMKNYQSQTVYFKVGTVKPSQIPITVDIIRLIFGIIDGDQHIITGSKKTVEVDFVKRLFPDRANNQAKKSKMSKSDEGLNKAIRDDKLTTKRILSSLKEEGISSEDFARLAVLFVLAHALAPTQGSNIGWSYTEYVQDVNTMTKYNWSEFIYDMLIAGLNKEPSGSSGCLQILAVSTSTSI